MQHEVPSVVETRHPVDNNNDVHRHLLNLTDSGKLGEGISDLAIWKDRTKTYTETGHSPRLRT